MSNFIKKLDINMAVASKVANNPKSPKSAEAVQANLKSIVMLSYDNGLFLIAGIDKNGKRLIDFTASKNDPDLVFWFGEGWQSKVIKIERYNNPDAVVKIEDIA